MWVKKVTAFVCGGLLVAGAACSGADSSSAGDKVRYGYDLSAQFTNTFDVSKSTGDCDSIPMSFIYDGLVGFDYVKGEPLPGIATKWVITGDDKKTIDFTLRDDVVFSDGTKLDAQAVKEALERNSKNDQLSTLAYIDTMEVVSPTQLKVNLENDQAVPFIYAMGSSRDGMIMAPKSFANAGTKPVGSGPFMLESFEPGRGITLTKNPKYWNKPKYDFPGIEFVLAKTGPPAVTRFLAGDIDIVRFESSSLSTLKNDSDATVIAQPSEAYLQFQFRLAFKDGRKSPFADERVRKAIRYALDAEEINQIVQGGEGEVANQSLPKSSPGYEPSIANAYPHDVEKAKDLLRQAGYPNGFKFTMAIPGPGIKNMQSQGELIQDQLSKIGVTADIKPILGQDIATQYYIAGGGDAFAAAHLASTFYPGVYYDQWAEFQFVPIWNGAERADITDLTLRAQATDDPAEAAALTKQAAKIVSDEALEVPIAFMPQYLAYDKTRIGGNITGQTDICKPPDLSDLKMKS